MAGQRQQQGLDMVDSRDRLAAVLPVLRRQVLEALEEPDSATGIARRLGLPRQKVNYHVRELEKAGFVELDSTRRQRGCTERLYRTTARAYLIDPGVLGSLGTEPEEVRDRFSSTYLLATAARLVREVGDLRRRAADAKKRLPTLTLQTDVKFRTPEERAAFTEELTETVARLAAKYNDNAPGGRSFRFVIGGHPVPKKTRTSKKRKTKERTS